MHGAPTWRQAIMTASPACSASSACRASAFPRDRDRVGRPASNSRGRRANARRRGCQAGRDAFCRSWRSCADEPATCRARSSSVAWACLASSSRFGPATSGASSRPPRAPFRCPSRPTLAGKALPFLWSLSRTTWRSALPSPRSALSRFQETPTCWCSGATHRRDRLGGLIDEYALDG